MTTVPKATSTRAGRYALQPGGYYAFEPAPLPPDPPIAYDAELLDLLSKATLALGRLDGAAAVLPNPDLFVAGYVRKEALLSSQIEGTQASLADVLRYEASKAKQRPPNEAGEVVNYIRAMNHGLERLRDMALSNLLIREIHRTLLEGVRGSALSPGEYRATQNWIGPPDSAMREALYVPPPPVLVERAMWDLEQYIRSDTTTPILIKCGLIHAQFETIHPFRDGNGRMGRLLITFLLCEQKVLSRPLLYLSASFKQHRQRYYQRLQAVRDHGDWEGWLKFFLNSLAEVADESTATAREILALRDSHRRLLQTERISSANAFGLLDQLFETPMVFIGEVAERLSVAYVTASALVADFVRLGLLEEVTGRRRNRLFAYKPYLDLLRTGTELPAG